MQMKPNRTCTHTHMGCDKTTCDSERERERERERAKEREAH